MSAIDPLGSAATRARTSADGPARTGLTPARRELLSAYAALDPKLHEELEIVEPGLVPAVDDPAAAVVRAAELWDATPDRPRIHPLQLAQAALRVFDGRTPDSLPALTPIVRVLAGPEHADRIPEVLPAIQTELLNRPERDLKLRWTAFQSAAFEALTTELKEVPVAWCTPGVRAYNGEIVARVETRLVVKKATDLDTLAAPAGRPGRAL